MQILSQILPLIIALILIFFTMLNVSNLVGYFKAKKVDDSLKLALNTAGKVVLGVIYVGYIFTIFVTLYIEFRIITDTTITQAEILPNMLKAINALTVITVIACLEFQDIYFIGKKNIMIGNKLFDIRRMRKFQFPSKTKMLFIYGQKEYSYSTMFVDLPLLKSKISKR